MVKLKNVFCCFIFMAFLQMQLCAMTTKEDRIINAAGQEILLKGVNWFGFNNQATMVDGLWSGSGPIASDFATIVYRMQLLGFNAVRLPFSFKDFNLQPQNLNKYCKLPTIAAIQLSVTNPSVATTGTIPPMLAPPPRTVDQCDDYFPNDNTLNRFLWTVNFFAKNGFYVLIDNHSEDTTVIENKQQWVQKWTDLVSKISKDPVSKSMLMVDILNEPDQFNIRWEASGNLPALKDLYISVMDAVYPVNPEVLFFVEGTAQGDIGANWGDGFSVSQNISNPKSFFDTLLTKPYVNQVVISPHVYPPSVTGANSDYTGSGLYARLNESFGYLTKTGYCKTTCKKFPVAIGEFGSRFETTQDIQSMQDIAKYLNNTSDAADQNHQPIGNWFYWSWNPNSSDTGGLVGDNWLDIQWKKIDYLVTLGLKPWYLKSVVPAKTGTLCLMVAPVNGLSKSDLKAISVGSKTFALTDFNVTICNTLPVGNYRVEAPSLATSAYQFTAKPEDITITDGVSTPVQISYVGTPIVNPPPTTGDFTVEFQAGASWQEDPTSGIYLNSINLYVKNNGTSAVATPWKIMLFNENYKKVQSYWNVTLDSIQGGKIQGTVKESWQSLSPKGINSVNVGMVVSSTSQNFVPQSVYVNGKIATITVKQ